VLPGGGARGAYEIGALSILLPALEARGERVEIWCGTSVGAINAAALSSLAHLPAERQVEAALTLWTIQRSRARPMIAPLAGGRGVRKAPPADAAARVGMPGEQGWPARRINVRSRRHAASGEPRTQLELVPQVSAASTWASQGGAPATTAPRR